MKIIQRLFKLAPFRVVRNCHLRSQHTLPRKDGWESVIGLEIHAQIAVQSKIFSAASVSFGGTVNSQVALLDASIPGTLPVLNRASVEAGVRTAIALSCELNTMSTFDRKHYFYSDLPAGYQITQQRNPLASKGFLEFIVNYDGMEPYYHKCKIHQLQLEQDSGKSLHDNELQRSLIDLNRAGIGLMEIVFEPDLRDGEEAAALIKELILILENIGTCNCKMEEGGLRVDANISVNRIGEPMGIRTEVKNLSSIRSVANAIEYEVVRQIEALESGDTVVNETRSFDAELKKTLPMRDKEMKQDYRFMPEPNLPPIRLIDDPEGVANDSILNIAPLKKFISDLPDVARKRIINKYGLPLQIAMIVINMEGCLPYFQEVMKFIPDDHGERVAQYILSPILSALNDLKLTFTQCPASPKEVAEIVKALEAGQINFATAKQIGKLLVNKDERSCAQIIKDEGMQQVSDDVILEKWCAEILENNPTMLQKFKNGNLKKRQKLLQKFMTEIIDARGGSINMKKTKEILQRLLQQ